MAKSFKRDDNVENITKSFFSAETLNKEATKEVKKVAESVEAPREKRAYNKKIVKENKTEIVTLRFTSEERAKLQELVEETESESVSSYIRKLLKREGL